MDEKAEKILKTEYSSRFDELRKKAMVTSYYKYGPMVENYDIHKCMDALGNIEKRLEAYKKTRNTEFLVDVANFAMIEFMYPSLSGAKYEATDNTECEISGISVNELKRFSENAG